MSVMALMEMSCFQNSSQASVATQVAMLRPHARKYPCSSSSSPIQKDTVDENRRSMTDDLCRSRLDSRAKRDPGRGQLAMQLADILSQRHAEHQDTKLEGCKATAIREWAMKRNTATCDLQIAHRSREVKDRENASVSRPF